MIIIGDEITNTDKNLIPSLFNGLKKEKILKKAKTLECYKIESQKYCFNKHIILTQVRFRENQSFLIWLKPFEIYNMVSSSF